MPESLDLLELEHKTTFFGPNPFASSPVIVARIGPSDGHSLSAAAWMRGCLLLREFFPEWVDPPGDALRQPMAQVGRTAARWALAALNETDGFLHDAGAEPVGAEARVWLGFHRPEISLAALKLAVAVLSEAARCRQLDRNRADSALQSLWRRCRHHHPDYQARVLMQAARARDIPVLPFLMRSTFWQYGWGCRSRVFVETCSNADGHLSDMLQGSKVLSKMVFAELGIPTPAHRLVTRMGELPAAIEAVGWPCVIKPISKGGGKGVTAGIRTLASAETAFAVARRYSDNEAIMVEAFVSGGDYRLMVIEGRFFAAVRREPASVIGDGDRTVGQLIAALNSGRSRNKLKSRYLVPITVDDVITQHMKHQGVNVDTVLEAGRRMTLRGNANRATGGVCIDATSEVHPHTKQMSEMIARAIGLATTGIDFVTTDIGKPWHECGAVIEVNLSPGVSALIAAGLAPVSVASAILGAKPARIPVRLVIAPSSELPQLLHHLRSMPSSEGFGWVCDGEAAISGMRLRIARSRPWREVEMLFLHTSLRRACLICSVEAIVRYGMPVDKVDSTALYRCGSTPFHHPAWMKVVVDHGGTISMCSDLTELRLADFATATLASG